MSSIYIYGIHSVSLALQHHPECVHEVWFSRQSDPPGLQQIKSLAANLGISCTQSDVKFIIDKAGSGHQGVMARRRPIAPLEESSVLDIYGHHGKQTLLLGLDGIQDPQNLGACLRVAAAAGVHGVLTPRKAAVAVNASVHKASSGTAEWVPWFQVGNMVRNLQQLKDQSVWVIGTDQNAEKSLFEADLSGPVLLLMGSEGQGLRRLRKQSCDLLVSIPMDARVESLNVSVATGICLYQILNHRRNET